MPETNQPVRTRMKDSISRRFTKIHEINRKYATPQIKMTPQVKLALLLLRLYLLFLVLILAYKFITVMASGGKISMI